MEFINPEEFKNQPKEIQKVFIEWWQPQQFDLYIFDGHFLQIVKKYSQNYILPYKGSNVWEAKEHCIPFFTEGQLRKFIEDKMCGRIETIDYLSDGYDFYYYDEYNNQYCIGEELGDNLLQAYWKVACEIAKESVEGGL